MNFTPYNCYNYQLGYWDVQFRLSYIELTFCATSRKTISLFREWTNEQIKQSQTCNVAVMYASAYGNTASLAQAISRGITKAGLSPLAGHLPHT